MIKPMPQHYTKLFNSIVTSTIWSEDDKTRLVWITMLALADRNGEVHASVPGLARVAGVPLEDCEAALQKFLGPDEYSRTQVEGGRRIEAIDGGWALINHAKYRKMASEEDRRERDAVRQRRLRERKRHALSHESHAESLQAESREQRADQTPLPPKEGRSGEKAASNEAKNNSTPLSLVFPSVLDNSEFRAVWEKWVAFRQKKKKIISPQEFFQDQLNGLATLTVQQAITCLEFSRTNQYQGLFPEKCTGGNNRGGSGPNPNAHLVNGPKPGRAREVQDRRNALAANQTSPPPKAPED